MNDDDDGGSRNITLDNLEQHLAIIDEDNLLVTQKDTVTVDDILRSCENDDSMTGNKLIII